MLVSRRVLVHKYAFTAVLHSLQGQNATLKHRDTLIGRRYARRGNGVGGKRCGKRWDEVLLQPVGEVGRATASFRGRCWAGAQSGGCRRVRREPSQPFPLGPFSTSSLDTGLLVKAGQGGPVPFVPFVGAPHDGERTSSCAADREGFRGERG